MKKIWGYLLSSLITGVVIVVPFYLCLLLLLKVIKSISKLIQPMAALLPEWLPREILSALVLLLLLCLVVGMIVRTKLGQVARQWLDHTFLERFPGYVLFRGLTQRFAGSKQDSVWQPALAEIEEALVPAFIIETFDDGRYTVFVPSSPTPLAGTVYILESSRVHLIDVSFSKAMTVSMRWGQGAKDLIAAMESNRPQKP